MYARFLSPFCALCILVLVLLPSCGSGKNVADKKPRKRSVSFLEKKIAENNFSPDWFKAKVKIKAAENYFGMKNIQANVRSRKDSVLWVSAMVNLGIKLEVGRALITPDSIKVLDKMNQKYLAAPFDYIYNYIDYPVDFQTLQQIFYGNMPPEIVFDSAESILGAHVLSNEEMRVEVNPGDYNLNEVTIKDPKSDRTLNISFDSYTKMDKAPFSVERTVSIDGPEQYIFDCSFENVKVNEPQSFPFKIPSQYAPMP